MPVTFPFLKVLVGGRMQKNAKNARKKQYYGTEDI